MDKFCELFMLPFYALACWWWRHQYNHTFKRVRRHYYRNEIDNWYLQYEDVYCDRCGQWLEFSKMERERK